MSELAFTKEGERFQPASDAAFWRPRRIRDRGLEVVFKKDGCAPLTIPIDATEDEFRREVDYQPGKYRLDQLDEAQQPIAGATVAYVCVNAVKDADGGDEPAAPASRSERAARPAAPEMSEHALLLREVVRVNAEVTKAVAERLSTIIEATATLVRAADGAGMPARQPVEPRNAAPELLSVRTAADEDDEDDDEVVDDEPGWMRFARDCMPLIEMIVKAKLAGTPALRNAAKARPAAAPSKSTAPRTTEAKKDADPTEPASAAAEPAPVSEADEMPEVTTEMRSHFMAIYAKLSVEEAIFAREVAAELTQAELARWMRDLSTMSVDDAVAAIRAQMPPTASEDQEVTS